MSKVEMIEGKQGKFILEEVNAGPDGSNLVVYGGQSDFEWLSEKMKAMSEKESTLFLDIVELERTNGRYLEFQIADAEKMKELYARQAQARSQGWSCLFSIVGTVLVVLILLGVFQLFQLLMNMYK